MSELSEDRRLEAAEYVLRLLDPEEQAVFEAALADDADLRAEVREWILHFEDLNADFPETTPPAGVKAQLMRGLFGAGEAKVPGARALRGWWDRVWLWQGATVAALLLAAMLGLQVLVSSFQGAPEGGYVAVIASDDQGLRLLARHEAGNPTLRLVRTAGQAPEGRVLELWAIRGDAAPVSLGVLPEDGRTVIDLPAEFGDAADLTLAVSEEPPGGSTTGAPSGEVLAAGSAEEI